MTDTDLAIDAVLRKVIEEPDEDLHRLAYGDLLQERGENNDTLWGRYVVSSVRVAAGELDIGVLGEYYRTTAALDKVPVFTNLFGQYLAKTLDFSLEKSIGGRRVTAETTGVWCTWDRGFVTSVRVTSAREWVEMARYLYWKPRSEKPCPKTAHPVARVSLRQSPRRYDYRDTLNASGGYPPQTAQEERHAFLAFHHVYPGVAFDILYRLDGGEEWEDE